MTMRLSYRRLAVWISSTSTLTSSAYSWSPRTFRHIHRFRGGATSRFMSNSSESNSDLRVGLCQFAVSDQKDENHQTAADFMKRAINQGAELIVLPEIWNSPYATAAFPEYAEELPETGADSCPQSPSAELLRQTAKDNKKWIVGGSIPERDSDGKIYNTCLVFNPEGKIVAKHRKIHLFDIDVPGGITFFESDTLSAGKTLSHFSSPWGNIGVAICYDIRFPELAMLMAQQYGCRILVYPGAFNMTTGPAHWELLARARANDTQCYVLTASQARTDEPETPGKYPHYTAWGHSTIVSPWGDVIATTDEKEGIIMADLDLTRVEEVRQSIPISKQKRADLYKLDEA